MRIDIANTLTDDVGNDNVDTMIETTTIFHFIVA